MSRIDLSEYFGDAARRSAAIRDTGGRSAGARREPVDYTYNAFLGYPLSTWLRDLVRSMLRRKR